MKILDFFKKRRYSKLKRLSINGQILKLKEDFKKEIKDFEHFKLLQIKKIEILRGIKEVWTKKWKEAEELVSMQIPSLIAKQLKFITIDIQYSQEEDFILHCLLETEGKKVAF